MARVLLSLLLFAGCNSGAIPPGGADLTMRGDASAPPSDANVHPDLAPAPCPMSCDTLLTCCDGACVYPQNDILNCGHCGTVCPRPSPFCHLGTCSTPPCTNGQPCNGTCCQGACCPPGQLCCEVNRGGPSGGPACTPPTDGGTCPIGCPACK